MGILEYPEGRTVRKKICNIENTESTLLKMKKGIRAPILMLTAKSELDDKVMGLDSGADDYLSKPFMMKELLARLRALGRRNINSSDSTLSFGDIVLDAGTSSLTCTANGQSVRLGEKEYRILEYLIANQGQILTREQLVLKIWGYENDAEYNNVEVYMSFTRKKIFERFYRADQARNSESANYGLGLAIARAIVTAHKGGIEVLCHNGKVEFAVRIPQQKQ